MYNKLGIPDRYKKSYLGHTHLKPEIACGCPKMLVDSRHHLVPICARINTIWMVVLKKAKSFVSVSAMAFAKL